MAADRDGAPAKRRAAAEVGPRLHGREPAALRDPDLHSHHLPAVRGPAHARVAAGPPRLVAAKPDLRRAPLEVHEAHRADGARAHDRSSFEPTSAQE